MNPADLAVRSAIKLVRQHFASLDLDLPDSYTDALANIDRQLTDRTALAHDPRQLTEAVAAALADGKDPAADKTVTRLAVRAQLDALKIGAALDDLATERRAATLHTHADQLLDTLTGRVDQANTVLTAARQQVPNLAAVLTDHHGATTLKPSQLAAWGEARDAVAQLDKIVRTWTLIVQACGLAQLPPPNSGLRPLLLADLDARQLTATVREHGDDATAAAIAGHPLALATPDEFARRVGNVRRQRSQRQQTQDQQDRRRPVAASR